jgi:hypothetical protein
MELLAAGWQESDLGVFSRRCRDNFRRSLLYGGGLVDVMEANCLARPSGEIQVEFGVLDGRRQQIDQLSASRPGRQGERLRCTPSEPRPVSTEALSSRLALPRT